MADKHFTIFSQKTELSKVDFCIQIILILTKNGCININLFNNEKAYIA